MTTASPLDFALALWARGLSVIPVPRSRDGHDGKRPALAWKPFQLARAAEENIRQWFATPQNIGIVTGAISRVVVVDTDSIAAEAWARRNLPRTPWRVRTSKGWHRYFRHPGLHVANSARIVTRDGRLALDVRGDGGFVIGPGSVHASGAVYTAEGDWSVPTAKLPAFWLGWIERPRPTTPGPAATFHGAAESRVASYLAACPRPVIGQGSDVATFTAACRLVRGFALPKETAIDLLTAWSGFDRWWIALKVASAERYGGEPKGGRLESHP